MTTSMAAQQPLPPSPPQCSEAEMNSMNATLKDARRQATLDYRRLQSEEMQDKLRAIHAHEERLRQELAAQAELAAQKALTEKPRSRKSAGAKAKSVEVLRTALRERGLDTTGGKAELRERLEAATRISSSDWVAKRLATSDYSQTPVARFRNELKARGLDATGSKEEMAARLREATTSAQPPQYNQAQTQCNQQTQYNQVPYNYS